jgi:hypothetical protein
VVLPVRGGRALADARQRKRDLEPARERTPSWLPADSVAPERAVQAAPQTASPHPQAQDAERPRGEVDSQPFSDQRQAQIAEHYARRQARISERAAERQAKAAGRDAVHQARAAAQRQRKAAIKAARGPWKWPEWSLVADAVAFIA